MGKGDKKSRKGKINRGSYGKTRPRKRRRRPGAQAAAAGGERRAGGPAGDARGR
jgi:30S ribosomal protein S31